MSAIPKIENKFLAAFLVRSIGNPMTGFFRGAEVARFGFGVTITEVNWEAWKVPR